MIIFAIDNTNKTYLVMSEYLDYIPSKFMKEKSEELVPASGKADTVAGEIVRAFDRITYRYWNDGDVVDAGYGIITVNSSFRYLYDTIPDVAKLEIPQCSGLPDETNCDEYEEFLFDLQDAVESYLKENPELEETPNDYDSREASDDEQQAYSEWQKEMYPEDEDEDEGYEDEDEDEDSDYYR